MRIICQILSEVNQPHMGVFSSAGSLFSLDDDAEPGGADCRSVGPIQGGQ